MRNFLVFLLMGWMALNCTNVVQAQTLQQQVDRAGDAAALNARKVAAINTITQAAQSRGAEGTPEYASVLRNSLWLLAEIDSGKPSFESPSHLERILATAVILPEDEQPLFQKSLVSHYKQILEQTVGVTRVASERITLGSHLKDPLFPGVVAIRSDTGEVCTGIFFKPDKVLTAAHCVCILKLDQPTPLHRVIFGDDFANGNFMGGNRIVRRLMSGGTSIYPSLSGAASSFCAVLQSTNSIREAGVDMALITLTSDSPVQTMPTFPATHLAELDDLLATTGVENESIRPFFAVGFGKSESWNRLSMHLIVSGEKRGARILNGRICPSSGTFGGAVKRCRPGREVAAFDTSGRDSCGGDSGGPLFVRNRDTTQWLLTGVTSRGLEAGDGCGLGGVYSLVIGADFRTWMQNNGVTFDK